MMFHPLIDQHWVILMLLAYMVLQLGLCFIISRFIRTENDYLLGGRTVGLGLGMFSLFATWFGAETVIGSAGHIASEGWSGARAEPLGYAVCLLLMGLIIAKPLRDKAYVTIGDFFSDRFGAVNEILSAVIMIPTSILWAAAQLHAFAIILTTVSPLSSHTALMLSMWVVIGYTCLGGLLADVISDLIQGILITLGLGALLIVLIGQVGGLDHALNLMFHTAWIQQNVSEPAMESWFEGLDVWLIPILGSLIAPEAVSRILATRSPAVAQQSCWYGALIYFLVGCLPLFIAILGRELMAVPSQSDQFLPLLVHTTMPYWAVVVFLGAVVSAILSTIDSTLLSVSALASHNVLLPFLGNRLKDPHKLLLARGLVVFFGFCAYWIATKGQTIHVLVETASAFGSAGFLVCVLGGLYCPGIHARWITVILTTGVLCSLFMSQIYELSGHFTVSLIICSLLYGVGWYCSAKTRQNHQASLQTIPLHPEHSPLADASLPLRQ